MCRPTVRELRAAGWTPNDLTLPVRAPALLTRRNALLVGGPFAVCAAVLSAESSAQAAAESSAALALTLVGYLAIMLLPQRLTLGRVSAVALHEALHALPLRAVGADRNQISVRVHGAFGGSCVAQEFVLRRGEFLCMVLAPALVIGVPLAGAAIAAFLVGWQDIPGIVVRNLTVALLAGHVASCWSDFRSARHVLRAGKNACADVRYDGDALKVRTWTAGSAGTPPGRGRGASSCGRGPGAERR